jgi:acyl carrier protein
MTTQEALNEVFQIVFDDESISVASETTANDIDGWDSLTHVNLILAVERKFKIKFSQKELLTQKNVGDLVRMIDDKIGR